MQIVSLTLADRSLRLDVGLTYLSSSRLGIGLSTSRDGHVVGVARAADTAPLLRRQSSRGVSRKVSEVTCEIKELSRPVSASLGFV